MIKFIKYILLYLTMIIISKEGYEVEVTDLPDRGYLYIMDPNDNTGLPKDVLDIIFKGLVIRDTDKLIEYIPILESMCLKEPVLRCYYTLFELLEELPEDIIKNMSAHFFSKKLMRAKLQTIRQFAVYYKLSTQTLLLDACRCGNMNLVMYINHERNITLKYYALEAMINGHLLIAHYILRNFLDVPLKPYKEGMIRHISDDHVNMFLCNYKGDMKSLLFLTRYHVDGNMRYNILFTAIKYGHIDILKNIEDSDYKHYYRLVFSAALFGKLDITNFLYEQICNHNEYEHINKDNLMNSIKVTSIIGGNKHYEYTEELLSGDAFKMYILNVVVKKVHGLLLSEQVKAYDLFLYFLQVNDTINAEEVYEKHFNDEELVIKDITGINLATCKYIYKKGFTIQYYKGNDMEVIKYLIKKGFSANNIDPHYLNYKLVKYLYREHNITLDTDYFKFISERLDYF